MYGLDSSSPHTPYVIYAKAGEAISKWNCNDNKLTGRPEDQWTGRLIIQGRNIQMIANKIVVKFKDGKIIKGWSTDFGPNKEIFHLHPLEEYGIDILEIETSSLKAVFFVKDYKGNKDYKKVRTFEGQSKGIPSQRKIVIIFKDGENFYGTTHSYDPERKGFFVYPIDPKDNNDRVFVVNPAVKSVKLQKFNSEDFQIHVYETV
jgi:small nuclear ribonucleoprotein (snRNP)-like protein